MARPGGSWRTEQLHVYRDTGKSGSHSGAESQALCMVLPGHWGTLWSTLGFGAPTRWCFLRRSAAPGAYLSDTGNYIGTWVNDSSETN